MQVLQSFPYDRQAAVDYANQWAYRRNPNYYDFEEIGGDCTNYASQCILAGTGVMNFTQTYGWYYLSLQYRAPAWTGVEFFWNFMTGNQVAGPYGREVSLDETRPGDICQLMLDQNRFQHTPIITQAGFPRELSNTLVAAHSFDVNHRPLDSYDFRKIRYLHIEGYRAVVEQ